MLVLKSTLIFISFRLQEILADPEGPDYSHAAKRRGQNIWYKGHRENLDHSPDMRDFPTDDEITESWTKGLELAQTELKNAGVEPKDYNQEDVENRWFFHPHLLKGTTDAQLDRDGLLAAGNDECRNDNMHVQHDAGDEYAIQAQPALNGDDAIELRAHFFQVADNINMNEAENDPVADVQVENTLQLPGFGAVHKSTLVAKLNSCPNGNLTWDRSIRVRYGKSQQKGKPVDTETNEQVGLFDDVAVYAKERGKPAKWKLGRVIRMRNKEKSSMEYRHPVNVHDTSKYPKLYFLINLYDEKDCKYRYLKGEEPVEYSLTNVIMKVTLTLDDLTLDLYSLDEHDRKRLDQFMLNTTSTHQKESRKTTRRKNDETAVSGEGLVVLELEPASQKEGIRTSQRKRKQRLFLTD